MGKGVIAIIVVILFLGVISASVVYSKPEAIFGEKNPDCSEFSGEVERDACFSQLAYSEQDENLCDNVQNSIRKDGCISAVALIKKDESLCDLMQNSIHVCISAVAAAKEDETLCNTLENGNRDNCIKQVAIQAKNPEICDGIENTGARSICIETVNAL